MTDNCASCFFSFIAPIDADPPGFPSRVGKRFCNRNAPLAQSNNPNAWLWPLVQDDFWCGEGANDFNGTPYNAFVTPPLAPATGTSSTGMFSLSAASSATVTDAAAKTTSIYKVWNISFTPTSDRDEPPSILVTPGAGSFGVATQDGSAVTGTWGYTIYN